MQIELIRQQQQREEQRKKIENYKKTGYYPPSVRVPPEESKEDDLPLTMGECKEVVTKAIEADTKGELALAFKLYVKATKGYLNIANNTGGQASPSFLPSFILSHFKFFPLYFSRQCFP
jgi:hypothetical protein